MDAQPSCSEAQHAGRTTDFAEELPFQMPNYFFSTPALATGGGAEVMPVGMLNGANWLVNNGYPIKGREYAYLFALGAVDTVYLCTQKTRCVPRRIVRGAGQAADQQHELEGRVRFRRCARADTAD